MSPTASLQAIQRAKIGSDLGFAIKGFKDGVKGRESLHDSMKVDQLFGPAVHDMGAARGVDEARR